MATERPLIRLWVIGALLVLLGLALLVGGGVLVSVGGSPFYLLAGIGFGAAGVLLCRGLGEALIVYAVLLAAILAWSLWEVGLDWWPLAARLDVAFVFGVLLLLPWIARRVRGPQSARICLGLAVGVSAVVAVAAGLRDPHEIVGRLPDADQATAAAAGGVPDGEWHAYGRTAAGQRWSPLAQITPGNVNQLQVAWQFRTGDVRGRPGDPTETTDEVTPLKIGSRLYFCTPHQSVVALDATTGRQAWRYDPKIATGLALQHQTCRGLSYQPPPSASAAGAPASAASATSITVSGRHLDVAADDG
ncbi:MAG TPA: membrane-bound PQQ-dependent dehydrogenase, glucose/quinate/shikimate family, partial [Burkholderiaceae bacterium]